MTANNTLTLNLGELNYSYVVIDNGISGIMYELGEPIGDYDILWESMKEGGGSKFYLTNFENPDNPMDGGVLVCVASAKELQGVPDGPCDVFFENMDKDVFIDIDLSKVFDY